MCQLSVIVPVYQVAQYIEASLESICQQTTQSMEIIIVNDGTKDDSVERALNILKKSSKAYKIIKKENNGLPAARNSGIECAEGKYICFIDSDDVLEKNHMKNMIQLMEEEKLEVAFSDFEYTKADNRCGSNVEEVESEVLDSHILKECFCMRKIKIHCCAMMLKKSYLDKVGIFNEKLRFGEDVEFIWRALCGTNKIGHIKAGTYKYLIRENSIMSHQSTDRATLFCCEFRKSINKLVDEGKIDKTMGENVYNRVVFGLMHSFAKQSDFSSFKNLIAEIDGKCVCKKLRDFPDGKIKVLAYIIRIFPGLSWRVMRKI